MPVGPAAGTVALPFLTFTRKDTMPSEIAGALSAFWSLLSQPETLSALASLGLAIFAAVTLWRERKRDRERAETVDAQIGTKAYLLHRELLDIMPDTWPGQPADMMTATENIRNQLAVLEGAAEELLELAPRASEDIARAVRTGAIALYRASAHFREATSVPVQDVERDEHGNVVSSRLSHYTDRRIQRGAQYVLEAEKRLRGAIDPDLLEADHSAVVPPGEPSPAAAAEED